MPAVGEPNLFFVLGLPALSMGIAAVIGLVLYRGLTRMLHL